MKIVTNAINELEASKKRLQENAPLFTAILIEQEADKRINKLKQLLINNNQN